MNSPILGERPQGDPQVRRPDTGLAARVLGWAPRIAWPEGLRRTIHASRQQHRSTG